MSKILINDTNQDVHLNDFGLTISANTNVEIDNVSYNRLASSSSVIEKLASGVLKYSDGQKILSLSDAINHIKGFYPKSESRLLSSITTSYAEFKAFVDSIQSKYLIRHVSYSNLIFMTITSGGLTVSCEIEKNTANETDFNNTIKPYANKSQALPAFADKYVGDKKLFCRMTGVKHELVSGENFLQFEIAYPRVKLAEIEIIDCSKNDSASFKILDTANGDISGIPHYPINQFGFSVNMKESYFSKKNDYDADLVYSMILLLQYNSSSAKTISVNYHLHEVV